MSSVVVNTQKKEKEKEEKMVWNVRTLPREIMKWIQGLDLSYSVKDPKRDLNNGFLIAEIFSRYFPGKIQMHSFDNSQNLERRTNNWSLLDLFFKKNDIPITKDNWQKILADNDTEELVSFMIKSYQFLTQRKLTKPPLANFVNSKDYLTSSTDNQGTTSFLLKDKGLEKIEDKKEERPVEEDKKKLDGSVVSENKVQLTNASSKRTNFLRVPSKPISQNVEHVNFQIDVKNLNVRQVTGSILKLRENKMLVNDQQDQYVEKFSNLGTQQVKQSMNNSHNPAEQQQAQKTQEANQNYHMNYEKQDKYSSIIDSLNKMLMYNLQRPESSEELKKFKVKNMSLTQVFADQIEFLSDEFVNQFFSDILHGLDTFIGIVSKDPNEIWKFFNFLFICMYNLSSEKQSLKVLVDVIKQVGERSLLKDANKTRQIFQEFFLGQIAQYISTCLLFEKKEMLIQIIYSFCPNEPQARHQMICAFKEKVNDMNIFMQALVILIQFEVSYSEANKLLFDDFIHYAILNIYSASTNLRTMSLAILQHIADFKYDIVHDQIVSKLDGISKFQWWENKCLAIILFSKILKGIINSEKYQSMVKNPSTNQKFFSVENEKIVSDMKEQIEKLARSIKTTAYPPTSDMILSTTFIYIVEHLGESKTLLELFLNLILGCNDETRQWVLYSENEQNISGTEKQEYNIEQQEVLQIQDNNSQKGGMALMSSSMKKERQQYVYIIHSDKSLKYKTSINSKAIQQYAADILLTLVDMIKNMDLYNYKLTYEYMDLIAYGFQYTDFKVINMESCEQIANTIKKYIFLSLCDEDLCEKARSVLNKLLDLQFHADVKVQESETLFSSVICLIYKYMNQKCVENLEQILNELVQEGFGSGLEMVKTYLYDVYKGILQMKDEDFISRSNLKNILEPLIDLYNKFEKEKQASNHQQHLPPQTQKSNIQNDDPNSGKKQNKNIKSGRQQKEQGILERDEISEIRPQESFEREFEEQE